MISLPVNMPASALNYALNQHHMEPRHRAPMATTFSRPNTHSAFSRHNNPRITIAKSVIKAAKQQ